MARIYPNFSKNLKINNHYFNRYRKFISNILRLNRVLDIKEQHHLIPKSLEGSDNKRNLIKLTPREHYICHYLLYKGIINPTTCRAFFYMSTSGRWGKKLTSKQYEKLKIDFIYHQRHMSKKTRIKISKSQIRRFKLNPKSNGMLNKNHRLNSKIKMSNSRKDKKCNRIWINNNKIELLINIKSKSKYLKLGYNVGRIDVNSYWTMNGHKSHRKGISFINEYGINNANKLRKKLSTPKKIRKYNHCFFINGIGMILVKKYHKDLVLSYISGESLRSLDKKHNCSNRIIKRTLLYLKTSLRLPKLQRRITILKRFNVVYNI